MNSSCLKQYNLACGDTLDEEQCIRLLTSMCKEKTYDYLSRREHSRGELEQKLRMKGFPSSVVEGVLDRVEDAHELSDSRYCEMVIRSRQKRNPEGKILLVQRLVSKGVDSSLARQCVEEAFEESGEEYLKLAYTLAAKRSSSKEKLIQKLQRKGFSLREIRQVSEKF